MWHFTDSRYKLYKLWLVEVPNCEKCIAAYEPDGDQETILLT